MSVPSWTGPEALTDTLLLCPMCCVGARSSAAAQLISDHRPAACAPASRLLRRAVASRRPAGSHGCSLRPTGSFLLPPWVPSCMYKRAPARRNATRARRRRLNNGASKRSASAAGIRTPAPPLLLSHAPPLPQAREHRRRLAVRALRLLHVQRRALHPATDTHQSMQGASAWFSFSSKILSTCAQGGRPESSRVGN